jgi:ligand-binding sensor protein
MDNLDLSTVTLRDVIDIEFLQRFQDDFAKGVGLQV